MKDRLTAVGISDPSFELVTVKELVGRSLIDRPLDGNHGEIHPKGDDFVAEGVPFIMASDIDKGCVNYENCKFISQKQAESLRKGFARSGDVLLTHKATMGKTAVVDYDKHPFIMLTPQVTYYRSRDLKRLNNRYLRYYFESEFFQKTLNLRASSGATRSYLGITEQMRLPIVLPPIQKQRKIAAILSAYDDLIENNKRRIVLLEKMTEEIYREWFVRMRFPGHEKTKFVKGVPKGWAMVKLENAFIYTGGGTPSKVVSRYWSDGDINWYTPSDITAASGPFLEKSADQCTEEGVANSSARLFPAYSVMMTSRATIGAIGINLTPACTNQGFITCIPNDRYPLSFLYHWLKLSKSYFELLSGGATFPELIKSTFRQIELATPPKDVTTRFEEVVRPMLTTVETLQRSNSLLAKSRDSLLPRLISGKLSVEDLDIQFPPSMREESEMRGDELEAARA